MKQFTKWQSRNLNSGLSDFETHRIKDLLVILHSQPLPVPGADLDGLLPSASGGVWPSGGTGRRTEGEKRGGGDLCPAHPTRATLPPRSSYPWEPMSSLLLGTQDGEGSPSPLLLPLSCPHLHNHSDIKFSAIQPI